MKAKDIPVGTIVVVTKRHCGNSAAMGLIAELKEIDSWSGSAALYLVKAPGITSGSGSWCVDIREATIEEQEAFHRRIYWTEEVRKERGASAYQIF